MGKTKGRRKGGSQVNCTVALQTRTRKLNCRLLSHNREGDVTKTWATSALNILQFTSAFVDAEACWLD